MDMANLPATTDESSLTEPQKRFLDAIADQISAGRRPDEIARTAYPHDARKRRNLRLRIWNHVRTDPKLAERIALRARGEHLLALVPATRALAGRASRGRPDAIKLLYEASGFHNPRIKHDHTGEIKIKLDLPRPKFDADVVDADVVE